MAESNPVDDLIAGGVPYDQTGWQGLNEGTKAAQKQAKKAAQAQFEHCQLIARAFNDGKGQAALARLKELTLDAPTWPSTDRGGSAYTLDQVTAYGLAREGQNSIYREILRCIRVAEMGPPE